MSEKLRKVALEMDSTVSEIGTKLENINDINDFLGNLRIKLDNLDNQYSSRLILNEVHSEIRVLSELLRYTTDDLNESHDQMEALRDQLFKKVVKERHDVNVSAIG